MEDKIHDNTLPITIIHVLHVLPGLHPSQKGRLVHSKFPIRQAHPNHPLYHKQQKRFIISLTSISKINATISFYSTKFIIPPNPPPLLQFPSKLSSKQNPSSPPSISNQIMGGYWGLSAVVLLVATTAVFTTPVTGNSEGDALYALRRSLNDPDKVLQSWDPNLVNPCTWFHVTCNQDNHVTRVDLGNSKLSGHLVPELGKLEHLQYLELYKNTIQGPIPAEIGNLKSLISLDLYNNNISGSIPPTLGKLKSLVFLRLNDNRLTGRIPRELIGISSLKVVDVSNNNLCGTIPTTGPFEHIPLNNFENNPRLEGPELQGLASYDTNCY